VTGRLAGKVAVITGTAGGQGRAAALLFAAEGATVVGTDLNADGRQKPSSSLKWPAVGRPAPTGYGDVALVVTTFGEDDERDRLALAAELSGLSRALWRCYTHPATAADSMDVNTEGWRRQRTRDGFAKVVATVREPELLSSNGMLMVSYDPVKESANRAGRALHRLGDNAPVSGVLADVAAELDAVERAELGDLTGRAIQAVLLTRESASPAQVAAADEILARNPLGGDELFLSTRSVGGVGGRRALASGRGRGGG
jgi:NAD(P)-dependent dehydrogenase (short-subunit alcohol dehydrogenase family)